jgi:hypothetical protein
LLLEEARKEMMLILEEARQWRLRPLMVSFLESKGM